MRCSWWEIVGLLAVLGGVPIVLGRTTETGRRASRSLSAVAGLPLALGLLVIVLLMSLRCGSFEIDLATVWSALWDYDATDQGQIIVRELHVPRTIIGAFAGACLAVAGALTQGVTRNPLGGPGILGINAGAAFAIVVAIFVAGFVTPAGYVWFAFAGALGGALLVYGAASAGRGGATPAKLALAGAVVTALLSSWTTALLLLDEETLDEARFWLAGSIATRDIDELRFLFPIIVVTLFVSLFLSRHVNALSLGEHVAVGLGLRVALVRAAAGVCVVVLAGASVALAGPVAFIGLAAPHIVRAIVGPDYRWILLYCLLVGPVLFLAADVLGRVIVRPGEIQVGIVSAVVGAPFLIYLVRYNKLAEL